MNIEIECSVCKTKILRRKGEVNRNAKIGRKTYCSLKCSGAGNFQNIPKEKAYHPENLTSRYDEYSMFRVFMHRINLRVKDRNKVCDITLKDLKEQWEKQDGICPYTGWKLLSPKDTGAKRIRSIRMASLDRIDSSKGYIKGNIEYVAFMAQNAKNNFDRKDVVEFCKAVAQNC
jgi:hypothetical protein